MNSSIRIALLVSGLFLLNGMLRSVVWRKRLKDGESVLPDGKG